MMRPDIKKVFMEFDLIAAILASPHKLIQHASFFKGVNSYHFGVFFLQFSEAFRNLNQSKDPYLRNRKRSRFHSRPPPSRFPLRANVLTRRLEV